MTMNSKDLDPRTLYSLAMVLILYEFYKSEFFKEDPVYLFIKIGLAILIFAQLIFLLLCGLSFAEYKDEKKLQELAHLSYTAGFQLSVVLTILMSFYLITNIGFKFIGIYFTQWGKILTWIINVIVVIATMHWHKRVFENKSEINKLINLTIVIWMLVITVFILSKILQK